MIITPSKCILFGEHAVVYGYRAISIPINIYSKINIYENNENTIKINLNNLNKSIKLDYNLTFNDKDFSYVIKAIELFSENYLDRLDKGFVLDIYSEIPISCGLGSSASITVGTIKALSKFFNVNLSNEEVAYLSYLVEKEVQGKASRTDTATIALRKALEIKNNNIKEVPKRFNNFLKKCKFLILYVEERKKRTAELVTEVAKKENKEEIFKEIDNLVDIAYRTNDFEEFGNLLYRNHILLDKLNISTPKINKVVEIANKYSYGAKLTGAGGGGCVIVLVDEDKKDILIDKLREKVIKIFSV
ncbi:mevalonate kinase [Methanocaldococcus indicus]|uniref:mevalonate kinase n=1 Tax=Methanocaldococcus indicus TaxID=213231 RepID=UPI003C6D081E